MSSFPLLKTGAAVQYPATRGLQYSTRVLRFVDGTEQRFRDYKVGTRKWIIHLALLDEDELHKIEEFFIAEQGRSGTFSFTDPWDGTVYSNCSLERDWVELNLSEISRGATALVIREDRD